MSKAKPASKNLKAVSPPVDPRVAIIDELGRLSAELKALEPKAERVKLLKAQIRAWAAELPAAESIMFDGEEYSVEVTARTMETTVNIRQAAGLLGDPFYDLVSITIENLQKHLQPEAVAAVTAKDRTGPRQVKPMRRAAPLKKAA